MKNKNTYMPGFGNHFATEALEGALPQGQNSPQQPPFGLYAEQLSGTAFTAPRAENKRTWLYRIRPSVHPEKFTSYAHKGVCASTADCAPASPNQLRWRAPAVPRKKADFIDGLITYTFAGCPEKGEGMAAHIYTANKSMGKRFFYNADGEMLLVPQEGGLDVQTEMGVMDVNPGEVALIPRGVKFQVNLKSKTARGYVCENFGQPFRLPDLGPIGANGLANPRDFLTPKAAFTDQAGKYKLLVKMAGNFWQSGLGHHPLDVVAWHGNYAPCKYELSLFNAINTVTFDHPDPSIFTVLTSPSGTPGVANADFVIFPPRWSVAENTFRPPYFHRNMMSEFMGLIKGRYDGKKGGFEPGGASFHGRMAAHGPDKQTFDAATKAADKPQKIKNTLAFMFETCHLLRPTLQAGKARTLEKFYEKCWRGLGSNFTPK